MDSGGLIVGVAPGSPAQSAGIAEGETLLSVNGRPVFDILGVRFHTYDAELTLLLANETGQTREVSLSKDEGEELGLAFDRDLFNGVLTCRNKCVFCFVDQMPPGLRPSLYLKDDDYRLSFLTGSYVSLTNLSVRDIEDILTMRVSPLRVSVQTTDPALRCRMMGQAAGAALDSLRRFAEAGIELHGQVVVCPGYNDGIHLQKTLRDLRDFRSVSVVPVGLTRHRAGLPKLRPVDRQAAREIIAIAEAFPNAYCGDELFVTAGLPIPGEKYYNGYPQIENGVGLVAKFQAEFLKALRKAPEGGNPAPFSIVTGQAASEMFARLIGCLGTKYPRCEATVETVDNQFFGRSVTVSGLMTGIDIHRQCQQGKTRLLLPQSCLRHDGDLFLDGMSPQELSARLRRDIQIVPVNGAALVEAIRNTAYGKVMEEDYCNASD